ncbi:hypothetical protein [Aromatoleum diolicum]|uniref:Uncharacterized protein n=1 Tax=Aromatoleum diolicum TaxID=75796 RepID=A0ABX1QG90_9RHOO|nr:hypothetical protein [Aromatoleum diolicum]NMG77468.1 hypothetical protein [Aromatoleum diolicum]
MATEKELDRALAAELESNPTFMAWLISQTKFAGCGASFVSCRADHPWGTHPFPVINSVTGESSTTKRQSETDVLLVVSDRDGRILGLHIENKVGAGKFTDLLNRPEFGGGSNS